MPQRPEIKTVNNFIFTLFLVYISICLNWHQLNDKITCCKIWTPLRPNKYYLIQSIINKFAYDLFGQKPEGTWTTDLT